MGEALLSLLDWITCAAIFAVGYLCGREASRNDDQDDEGEANDWLSPGGPLYMDHTHGGETDESDAL